MISRKIIAVVAAGGLGLLAAQGAGATTLSGTYSYAYTELCTVGIDYEGVGVTVSGPTQIHQGVGTLTFNPSTSSPTSGTVHYAQTEYQGDGVNVTFQGTDYGTTISGPTSSSGLAGFLVTGNKLVLRGTNRTVYDAVYGQVSNGIAGHVVFVGSPEAGCTQQGTLTLQ